MAKKRSGRSGSKKPLKKAVPTWVKLKSEEIEKIVVNLAKQNVWPSKIGLILRDSYAIPSVKRVTGKSVLAIIKEHKLVTDIPEDLYFLLKKAVIVRRHLGRNKKDKISTRGLMLTESKIRRIAKYYIKKGVLPKTWKYDSDKAKLLVKL